MHHFWTTALLGSMAMAQSAPAQPVGASTLSLPAKSDSLMPRIPQGKTTVMGGEIRNVDSVRDQFTLKVFGGHSVKIFFDERTLVYRNGKKIPVLDLRADDHASVQTALDGTSIFAVRINMLSQLPEDDFRGRVSAYNPQTRELTIVPNSAIQPITLDVPSGTPVSNIAQDGSSTPESGSIDFTPGSLVDVKLKGGHGKHGVATNVDILAVPGATFVFAGKLTLLDLHSGKLVVLDPRDNQAYPITFSSSLLPIASQLHEGSPVKVTTSFDGKQYVATEITVE